MKESKLVGSERAGSKVVAVEGAQPKLTVPERAEVEFAKAKSETGRVVTKVVQDKLTDGVGVVAEIDRPNPIGIVRPVPKPRVKVPPVGRPPFNGQPGTDQVWAPAWFYSALNWLGKRYFDANHVEQAFSTYLAGSDVDPYAELGSTRLFLIAKAGDSFLLSIAADADSVALATDLKSFPNTDAGIREMYVALGQSPVFAKAKYCYVPGRIGPDLDPESSSYNSTVQRTAPLFNGYDPGTGLRASVLGSAVSQVVPLDRFLKKQNEQIYDSAPTIVPLVTALVYNLAKYNTLGATTFVLPTVYLRDRISVGTDAVSRAGQTALLPGGPGYEDSKASDLKFESKAVVVVDGTAFMTVTFDKAKVITTAGTSADRVELGVAALTYAAQSPLSVFKNQRIIGLFRDDSWTQCLGLPIWDYGQENSRFTALTTTPVVPETVYDPTAPFLNGGSLQNVVRSLRAAKYLYPVDILVNLVDSPRTSENNRLGLLATAAALDFTLSASAANTRIVDQLDVPVVVSVTMTPTRSDNQGRRGGRRVVGTDVEAVISPKPGPVKPGQVIVPGQVVGGGGNQPAPVTRAPITVQAGLTASIPREALEGTSILSIESGTPLPEQGLGDALKFKALEHGMVVNLVERERVAPQSHYEASRYELPLAGLDVTFALGVSYVLSLTGGTLTVRGSDGSTATAAVKSRDPIHTYVGMMVFDPSLSRVRLYAKLEVAVPAPAVGTHGVLQSQTYSVRLKVEAKTSTYDLLDASGMVVARDISVATPKSSKGTPHPGDLYFGSFIGGDTTMSLWSVPIFLRIGPGDLPRPVFGGTVTLDAQVSAAPAYKLQITDSSVFVFTNVNVDTLSFGSFSDSNVFLACAVINSAPDDRSSVAFAPNPVLMGLVRQVREAGANRFVFVPADDSVVIGSTRYMLSVIDLESLDFDPSARPYPPAAWPQRSYWQFANKHVPYVDVRYEGATQEERIACAEADAQRIGKEVAERREPMHLYLEANPKTARVWPIVGFPFDSFAQTVDNVAVGTLADAILQAIQAAPAVAVKRDFGTLDPERITLPEELRNPNPYYASAATTVIGANNVSQQTVRDATQSGKDVSNLSPTFVAKAPKTSEQASSMRMLDAQKDAAARANLKIRFPGISVGQEQPVPESPAPAPTPAPQSSSQLRVIYGFSIYDVNTREAYLVALVAADQEVFDKLPQPTENLTYDPYYVRVVSLRTRRSYNMSIIVPAMAHDRHGHFARLKQAYDNAFAKTDELPLGYLHSLFDQSGAFDMLQFGRYPYPSDSTLDSEAVLFTDVPYSRLEAEPPGNIEGRLPTPYFLCRRKNWNADCHLMRATHEENSIAYVAYGAGDLVPVRLNEAFDIDKRSPAHLYKLTYTFSDRQYQSAKAISFANRPYVVAATTGDAGAIQFMNFSIDSTAGTADLSLTNSQPLAFPEEIYVVGQASTSLVSIDAINAFGFSFSNTGDLLTLDQDGVPINGQEFTLIPYNNLVYMIRAVSNQSGLGVVGGLGAVSGLLIDTFVPRSTGNLTPAQGARHKRSQLQFFGSNYTPSTMVDSLDNLDFTSITGETFFVPTIFIPIPEIDATKGFIADITNFLGQQFWTFIYPEIVARAGEVVNGVNWDRDVNIDGDGKPVLSLQKLHFVYDPLAVLFTPNDLEHKYPLQPKQQVMALTNAQIREGICWRSANVQEDRLPPRNVCAQQILPVGPGMDRPNIIYSPHNRPVSTPAGDGYQGMALRGFLGVSGTVYNIEEKTLQDDQVGSGFISQVSSIANMSIGVLFEYDNDDLGTFGDDPNAVTTKGIVFLNGYLSATGYAFSSPDHFDVNDVLRSQVPLLEQIANTMGMDVAYFNTDMSLPRQFWSLEYDVFTAQGAQNFIVDVPPAPVDPGFSNRTRSLLLNLRNDLQPDQVGMMDTFDSVVSANLHLSNGVTGAVFLNKKADRDVASIGTNPDGGTPLYGLPTKYDFFLISRDHYWTLKGASFELIDQGYALCLVDDGSGTGGKVAKYFIDEDGSYNELYTYVLYSPNGGVIESKNFTLKVTLGAPADPGATPRIPQTPNNVNPGELVERINKSSELIYAAFGPSTPGQAPAFLPIQAVAGAVPAAPIVGAPGFDGYDLNVANGSRQPVRISQIHVGDSAYPIAGSTTVVPVNPKTGKERGFYGSISHGLDRMLPATLQGDAPGDVIPRPAVPAGPSTGLFGGNGLGALVETAFSRAFQGSGAVPPAISGNPTPGTTMDADDTVFYTYNAADNTIGDSKGKQGSPAAGQYFVDSTTPGEPIYGVIATPTFRLNGNSCSVILSTTAADGVTSRYTLVIGGRSYLFEPGNTEVIVDRTKFTFNPLFAGKYTVTYSSLDEPVNEQSPSPVDLTPFSLTMGGKQTKVDVFNEPGALASILTGVKGRLYGYDPVRGEVTIREGASETVVPLETGLVFPSSSNYGYVLAYSTEAGTYTVNGAPTYAYSAATTGAPATYALMTAPQMFTLGGNFYTFDQDQTGAYVSVTGNEQTYPVNPYQFSINGRTYIINTNVQPHTIVGGGSSSVMTNDNTQFVLNGVQYTISLKSGSLAGASISGQFNVTQGHVVVIENFVYQLDVLNGQIVGNGATYPLTTSGATYTITTTNNSFTVTTQPNGTTVTIGNVVYQINNTTVVGDGIVYPILVYRTFVDAGVTYSIGFDGIVNLPAPFTLSGESPFIRSTFTDGAATYTVNDIAAFDGTTYFRMSGTLPQFTAGPRTYTLRSDGVSIAVGGSKTYLGPTTGPLTPNQFPFGTQTIFFDRATDLAAFDGQQYLAIANNQFTDTLTGETFTLNGSTAVHDGNSYEIFSNLGAGGYFEVPGGKVYYVNMPVANTGSASGDVFNVFPATNAGFTIPLRYTITVSAGVVTVDSFTFTGGPTVVATLTGSGSSLTGGFFVDPVTKITYTCVVNGVEISFVDSSNVEYPFPAPGTGNQLIANVVVATGVTLAVDNQPTPAIYPVRNNQFTTGPTTYAVNVPIAYANAAGPFFPMVNGRFIVPAGAPVSSIAYTVRGGSVTKGYVVSIDDQFSVDGNVVYTVNAVNVVKASNQATLSGAEPNQTLTVGGSVYSLDSAAQTATIVLPGVNFDTGNQRFTATVNGVAVTYKVTSTTATDDRKPKGTFPVTTVGSQRSFTDTTAGVSFTFDASGNNPVSASFVYSNRFFTDANSGVTFYIDVAGNRVEALSYLPETTAYAFTPADGQTYLIHYNDVRVEFPVISGANVNAGIAAVRANTFIVDVDEVEPVLGGPGIPVNVNSFEINGDFYTIAGTPAGADYSACTVIGEGQTPHPFTSPNTFRLGDSTVTYTLVLDAANLPIRVTATFPVRPSRNLLLVNDDVYVLTYNTVSTGSLLGQGQAAIAIANSSFKLPNRFDGTKAKFVFANLDIFNAASVLGTFTVNLMPTFFIDGTTYTFDPVQLFVSDDEKRPFPLLPNPVMFNIGGQNYVIDSNRIPHAVIGNDNVSPLSTDVTVEAGEPIPHSTFALGGQIYAYVEDDQQNLLTIMSTKSFMIAQPGLTFKLDSSLVFTLSMVPPAAGTYPGNIVPIGTATAGGTVLNVYPGTSESGGADFFTYKNTLYTLVKSADVYIAVRKSFPVFVSKPAATQRQLAVFDLDGTTYLATTGTTNGDAAPAGINPGTLWAATSVSNVEEQFGLVYGFGAEPTSVTRSGTGLFQFQAVDANGTTTLYDVLYTRGANTNVVKVDVPELLPTFTQSGPFTFAPSSPLMFETGGYNAFTPSVSETNEPTLSFAAAYKTPITTSDTLVDSLLGSAGDFSVEFWHSIPADAPDAYHPFTYSANTAAPLVHFVDIDFEDDATVFVQVNDTVLRAAVTPPVFSSGWRHVAVTYQQPYTMLCQGAGFEVKKANNFNVNREFSIAMTFSVSDVDTEQGLLYKGTGSETTNPQLVMSYRVGVSAGHVTLQFTDANDRISELFVGPAIASDQFFQLLVVKRTSTPSGDEDNPDPYLPPFDVAEFGTIQDQGMTADSDELPEDGGDLTLRNVRPAGDGANTKMGKFSTSLTTMTERSYEVSISVREVHADGTFGDWTTEPFTRSTTDDAGLAVMQTGMSHLVIGEAFADDGRALPLGSTSGAVGNIRTVYLFNQAINRTGIRRDDSTTVDIAAATSDELVKAGLLGIWVAQYDPNGLITNRFDRDAFAITTNQTRATLAPLAGHEREGVALYVNGVLMATALVTGSSVPASMEGFSAGDRSLKWNAGLLYRLCELSIWSMARQPFQVVDDMFGRLIVPQPFLEFYLSGSFELTNIAGPVLPMNKFIDNIEVSNAVASVPLVLSNASLDLQGCPAVGRCGPLVTPNLYTPPSVALTVCDTVPQLATYSVTLNSVTSGLAGALNEAYVYVKDGVLTLYAGKKLGDLKLTWVSQEQGDVQLVGYIEGAPPAPMANLTNKNSYAGATSVTLSVPTKAKFELDKETENSNLQKTAFSLLAGVNFSIDTSVSPFGFGLKFNKAVDIELGLGFSFVHQWSKGDVTHPHSSEELEQTNKFTVQLDGALAPVTSDPFMATLNSVSAASLTAGTSSGKSAILPNPNLGGFTASNAPTPASKAPPDEKFGARMFKPSPYGQAFVTSQTLDVYQQTLVQTNTVFGFVRVPNAQIPRDFNIVSFRMNSQYIRPGVLDGVVGYVYNPATLPTGAKTYATSTGEMAPLYDKNFSSGEVGHDASYMRVVEAYKLKRQIDQQSYQALALYKTRYDGAGEDGSNVDPSDSALTPGLDFYNEYIWTAGGGTQEVKHTYTTTYQEAYVTKSSSSTEWAFNSKLKLTILGAFPLDLKFDYSATDSTIIKTTYGTTGTTSFDVSANFSGLDTDTQMRYAANNDAHFVMKNNSMFNPNNQSGLNLVIGSDGLVYNVVPNVSSGAGLPLSNDIDDSMTYTQPQPSYTSGNANGITGALEAYDRPGKVKQYRTYAFFLQPRQENADTFWDEVVDPVWLANSEEADARAMRDAQKHASIPWRLFYRVTYCERFLPPVSNAAVVVPEITPVMAVPVLDPASDFIFKDVSSAGPRPPKNPDNDIEANVVLAAPTTSGRSAFSVAPSGPTAGQPVLPNNVIPFDLASSPSSIVSFGSGANKKLLGQLASSVLGLNTVAFGRALPGSTKLYDVMDPLGGAPLYTVYQDPNGLTVNVMGKGGITVYEDVNGNPIQYYDGKGFHSLQADYVATNDGTVTFYVEPPSTYDQSTFDLTGDYDLFGHPGDQWRYYLVSGISANMTSQPSVAGNGPFLSSDGYTGLRVAPTGHASDGSRQVRGYVLVKGMMQWPHLNSSAETFADVHVYKAMSLFDTFPIGDPEVLIAFLKAQYPAAPFVSNDEICIVFAKNIVSFLNAQQQALLSR